MSIEGTTSTARTGEDAGFSSFKAARREARRNYLLHGMEGGLYIGGLTLLAAESVAPAMIALLGGPNFIIALMPMLTMIGMSWPSFITAHHIERLPRVLPLVRMTGILQRLPYLAGGLALLFAADRYSAFVLVVVVLTPFLSGTFCGISFPAWIELVSKTVAQRRRSSLWAFRNIIGGLLGLAAGVVIQYVLTHFPGATGFGILHLCLFGLLMLSYVLFLRIREPFHAHRLRATRRTFSENLRNLPELLRGDANLRNYTFMRICATGIFVMVPFMAIHALEVTGEPKAFLGKLVMAQMVGFIGGNVVAGYLGDRYGARLPTLIARVFIMATCLLSAMTATSVGFLTAFLCFGAGTGMMAVGATSLSIDICPPERRPTYVAFLTSLMMPSMLLMAGVSAGLRSLSSSFGLLAGAAFVLVSAATVFTYRIRLNAMEP